jgi:hypothetical protein
LDPEHVKAHYRRGLAGLNLGRHDVVLADAQWCVAAQPTNAAFVKLLEDVRKVGGWLERRKKHSLKRKMNVKLI